jgi:hypothetical protein
MEGLVNGVIVEFLEGVGAGSLKYTVHLVGILWLLVLKLFL